MKTVLTFGINATVLKSRSGHGTSNFKVYISWLNLCHFDQFFLLNTIKVLFLVSGDN